MGLEWAALLLPAMVGVILHCINPRKVTWYEAAFPMLPAILMIPAVKLLAETSQVTDYERHGGWVVEARYFEEWDEYHTRVCTSVDAKGNTTLYDCSYVEWHPASYELEDSNGYQLAITKNQFEMLCQKFGNRGFRDMYRSYYTEDGDQYFTRWGGTDATMQPLFTEHRYENRVQATRGVLNFPYIEPQRAKQLGLYEFPALVDNFNDPAVLGQATGAADADHYLQQQNAKLGKLKEVRFWLLLFHDKPRETGYDQESYWVGGNKNEIVVTVGLDKATGKPLWCHPFCWSPDGNTSNDAMKIEIRDFVERQKQFQPLATAQFMVQACREKFKRKSFKEFSYLTVDMPVWAHVVIWLLTIVITVVMGVFIVVNKIDEDQHFFEWLALRTQQLYRALT